MPSLLGPRDQRPVARDLVVLGGLGGGDQAGVQRLRIVRLADDFLAFLDDALDRRAGLGLRRFADDLEHLLEPGDVLLGLFEMAFEGCLSSGAVAFLAIFGSAFTSCFSAK